MVWRLVAPSPVAFAYALLSYAAGNFRIAEYLQVPFYPFAGELTVVCSALIGAGLGFLWFNCYPAKVFMGDTGSLAIGGMIGVVAICCKQELLLVVVGGVFVIEAVSVILQVMSFKLTGKRIFRHVSASSSLRIDGLEGKHRHRSVLDSVDHLRVAWSGDTETEMKTVRYKNQNIAVLGAGLSGSAAALLLRSEGAQVTVLDSAEEKNLLKSTIDNLRTRGVRVICGAAADEDSSAYQMAILSPGIDPASRLARNFLVARN